MPFEFLRGKSSNSKAKNDAVQQDGTSGKTALRGASFEDGEKALMPGGEAVQAKGGLLRGGAKALGGALKGGAKAVGGALKGTADVAAPVGAQVKNNAELAGGVAMDNASMVGGGLKGGAKAVGGALKGGAKVVGGGVKDGAKAVGGGVKDGAKAVGGGVKDGAKAVGGSIKDGAKAVGGSIKDGASALANTLGGGEVGTIPELDENMDADEKIAAAHERALKDYGPIIEAFLVKQGVTDKGDQEKSMKSLLASLYSSNQLLTKTKLHDELQESHAAQVDMDFDHSVGGESRKVIKDDPFNYEHSAFTTEQVAALRAFGLSADEMMAINLYTSDAAYPMNQVLRGELTDEASIKAYLPWALRLDKALSKMPPEVRNMQKAGGKATEHPMIDPSQDAGKMLDITSVPLFRVDGWTAGFMKEVHSNWKVGGRITNPCFMSTTVIQGSYSMFEGVDRVLKIKDAKAAASIMDLSSKKHENEVLFRPGVQMKITKITSVGGPSKKAAKTDDKKKAKDAPTSISDVSASFKQDELKDTHLEVEATVEGAPGGDTAKAGDPGKAGEAKGKTSGKEKKGDKQALEQANAALVAMLLAKSPLEKA